MGQERPWRLRTGAVHKRICWRDDVTVSLNNSHHRRMKFSVHAKPGYGPARHWFERKREGEELFAEDRAATRGRRSSMPGILEGRAGEQSGE